MIDEGLAELKQKYGSNGTEAKSYHNEEHAKDVMAAARTIGDMAAAAGKIARDDVPLLELAACYHDMEHSLLGRQNEDASAAIIMQKMRQAGVFSDEEIGKVKRMIEATIVEFPGGTFTQSATDDYITQIMADADMANLGKEFEVYWDRARKLWSEHHSNRIQMTPGELDDFINSQITFLQSHTYYTPETEALFPHKASTIARLQAQL